MRHLSTINELYKKTLLSASEKARSYNQPEKSRRFMDHAWKKGRVHNLDRISSLVINTSDLDFRGRNPHYLKVDDKHQKWYIVGFKFIGDYMYDFSSKTYGIKFLIELISEFGIDGCITVQCFENGSSSLQFKTTSDELSFTFKDRKKAIDFKKMLSIDGVDELLTYIKTNNIQGNPNEARTYPADIFEYFVSKYNLTNKQTELLNIAYNGCYPYLGVILGIKINKIYSEVEVVKDPGSFDMSKSSTTTKAPINYKFKS